MGLADLHLHTIYSYDGTATVPAVLRRARELGLNVIAITDHDEIAGALEAVKLASHYGVEVIPGSEITT
ncbi:MAG TPA: PHP domain-containing protein, partial [Anaerolineales bacterium]|nr:PHP domain-containing protein [Anaerolineales bacterium]